MSAEFLLALASAAFGGAVTYTVCKHMPGRTSPEPDLDQVHRLIDIRPKTKPNGLLHIAD